VNNPPQFFPPVPINIPGNQGLVTLVPGIPVFVPQQIIPVYSTAEGQPLNEPTFYSPPLTFQQDD
jgi:hypothetical protein